MRSISISPPPGPFSRMTVRPPGSKSHTIRALFAAAGAAGVSTLSGALVSDDTERARDCLTALGAGFAEIDGHLSVTAYSTQNGGCLRWCGIHLMERHTHRRPG